MNEKEIINYLNKNRSFLIKNPELLNILLLPSNLKKEKKIIDFNSHKINKLEKENKKLKIEISDIMKNIKINLSSQNKILKSSLKILRSKSIDEFFKTITLDCCSMLNCNIIHVFSNLEKLKNERVIFLNVKNIEKIFNNKNIYQLNEKKYLNFFFNFNVNIKSYILTKLNINKKFFLIICFGSEDINKFSKTQSTDFMNFFSKICEDKFNSLLIRS